METYINYNGHFAIDFVAGSDEYNTWSTFALVPEKKPVAVPPAIQNGTLTAGNGEWRFYLKDNEESYSQYLDIIADIDRKNFTVRLHHSPDDITEYEEYTAFITVGAPQTDENHTIITISAVLYPSAAEWAEHDEELSITFGADQSTSYNTWTDWHLIPDETLKIVPPQLKEKYVDIPGRNGAIDLCNAVVGLPRFERMTGSLSFTIYDNDPDAIYNDMLDNLHGHKFDEVEIMGKSYDGRWVIESYEPDGEEPKITLGYNLILHDWTFNEDPDTSSKDYYAYVKSVSEDAAKTAEVIAAEELLETELDETTDILASVTVHTGSDGALFHIRNTTSVDAFLTYVGAADQIVSEYQGHAHGSEDVIPYKTYSGVAEEDIEEAEGTLNTPTGYTYEGGVTPVFIPALPGKLARLRKLKTDPTLTVLNTYREIVIRDFLMKQTGTVSVSGGRTTTKTSDCPSLVFTTTSQSGWNQGAMIAIRHEGLYYTYPYDNCTASNVGSRAWSVEYKGKRYFAVETGENGAFQYGIPNSAGNSYRHWYGSNWHWQSVGNFITQMLEFFDGFGLLDILQTETDAWIARNGGGSA